MSADNWTTCPKCGGDFREDYCIGFSNGKFEVDYRGSCGTSRQDGCGYKFTFLKSEDIPHPLKPVSKREGI